MGTDAAVDSSRPCVLEQEGKEAVLNLKASGHCARFGCQTINVLGVPKQQESITTSKLAQCGLKLQTACSGECHQALETAAYQMHTKSVSLSMCQKSVQSPCQECQKMVSTKSEISHNGSSYRTPKPSAERGTLCGVCWKFKGE